VLPAGTAGPRGFKSYFPIGNLAIVVDFEHCISTFIPYAGPKGPYTFMTIRR
jgi:hypothetical protein